jgi:hypothetical protein
MRKRKTRRQPDFPCRAVANVPKVRKSARFLLAIRGRSAHPRPIDDRPSLPVCPARFHGPSGRGALQRCSTSDESAGVMAGVETAGRMGAARPGRPVPRAGRRAGRVRGLRCYPPASWRDVTVTRPGTPRRTVLARRPAAQALLRAALLARAGRPTAPRPGDVPPDRAGMGLRPRRARPRLPRAGGVPFRTAVGSPKPHLSPHLPPAPRRGLIAPPHDLGVRQSIRHPGGPVGVWLRLPRPA